MTKPRHIWWLLLMTTHQDSKVTAGETVVIVSFTSFKTRFFHKSGAYISLQYTLHFPVTVYIHTSFIFSLIY